MTSIHTTNVSEQSEQHLPCPRVDVTTYSRNGWMFEAVKGCISGRKDLSVLEEELKPPTLPEMCFGTNKLTVEHQQTGTRIEFHAHGALSAWASRPPRPIRLKVAQKWSEMNASEILQSNATILDYDWTFTTDYAGSIEYGSESARTTCFKVSADRIDRGLLLERAPILFNAEIPLYESEMDDNGVSSCTVKIRVMPKCWFVLMRFWLRVDDTLLRIREARYFCAFHEGGTVLREIKHVEATFEELAKAGAPSNNAAFVDADSASTAMQAVAPIGVALLKHEQLLL